MRDGTLIYARPIQPPERVTDLAGRTQTAVIGTANVDHSAPFGGTKTSGVGTEGGAACEAVRTEETTKTSPTAPPPRRRFAA